MEEHDEENPPLKKAANFIKWLSRKHAFEAIVLHSFSHLSESKAEPTFAADFLNQLDERLQKSGFNVHQTPYGYFLNLEIKAPGFSLARVFKSF
jgi:predicted deacetylase